MAAAARVLTLTLALSCLCCARAASERYTLAGGQVMEVEVYPGVSRWKLIPNLWVHKTVNVTCPGTADFSVYVASDPSKLADEYGRRATAWCGLKHTLSWDSRTCVTRISPFQETAVAVVKPSYKIGHAACEFHVSEQLWPLWLLQGALGWLLFSQAHRLVESPVFRLGSGTAGFVLLSTLIVAFIIYRSVPNKKHMAAATALFGSTFLGLLKYFFGTWIPSFQQLISNKWALGYMAASGLIGLAVTYYYDDPANEKLNTILKTGLQLVGLAMVALSTAAPEVSVGVAAALALSHVAGLPQVRHAWESLPISRRSQLRRFVQQPAAAPSRLSRLLPPFALRMFGGGKAPETAGDSPTHQTEVRSYTGGDAAASNSRSGLGTGGLSTPPLKPLVEDEPPISPLVQSGLILNEGTGRTIQIGKATYNKLVGEGYEVDRQRGVMTPPGAKSGGGRPSSPRKGSSGSKRGGSGSSASAQRSRASGLSAASGLPLPD